MTERFDRTEDGDKIHMISLGGLCHYDFNVPGSVGYEDAAMAIDDLGLPYSDKRQLFKRMVFNIIFRNQDDHVKNIAFLLDKSNTWRLAPAFDITFSYREDSPWVNRHQMTVNGKRDNFTLFNFKEVGSNMNLKRNEYLDVLKRSTGHNSLFGGSCRARRCPIWHCQWHSPYVQIFHDLVSILSITK